MKKNTVKSAIALLLIVITILSILACTAEQAQSPTQTSATTPVQTITPTITAIFALYQLEYRLIDNYPDLFWCDPDYYPVSREGQEQANAIQQFPAITANSAEFSAILERLDFTGKIDYTGSEKLDIYRQHKLLTRAVFITSSVNIYEFSLRTGQNQGWHIEGTVTQNGQIKELKKEPSFNTCPICLSKGTQISTPDGPVAVEDLGPGMVVWTISKINERIAAPVMKISSTEVPASFEVFKLTLNDGRSITASPKHPTLDMRSLGDYQVGDCLDGSLVLSVETIAYGIGATYDLLPYGGTGLYWANDILLMSTLNGTGN